MSDAFNVPSGFDGHARLFPLPNLVLIPKVVLPLHIFEPRYRQMTADALAGDRLIAMVLLKEGVEDAYEAAPPIHTIACLGKIVDDQRLPDGRYHIVLRGLHVISWLAAMGRATEPLAQLLQSDMPLGDFVDILSYVLPLSMDAKQAVLEELDIKKRAQRLLLHFLQTVQPTQATASPPREFPPEFSSN
jgi:Lon protease-like protein